MEALARLFTPFIQHPERSALVAGVFFALWLGLWMGTGRGTTLRDLALLIPATSWGLYAIWEWAVNRFSPEADIRFDLLIIFPLLIIAAIAGMALALIGRLQSRGL
jgi:hypothetical protein